MIYELLYALACVGFARYNALLIKQGKRIYHGLNALVHLAAWAVVYLLAHDWIVMICLPFIGRIFFDTALNLFRGLDLGYVSDNPKSWTDKLEKRLFEEDGLAPKLFWMSIVIGFNLYKTLL